MLHDFSIRQFLLTKRRFLVHITTRKAPYIHLSHDSILDLWWTFPECVLPHSLLLDTQRTLTLIKCPTAIMLR